MNGKDMSKYIMNLSSNNRIYSSIGSDSGEERAMFCQKTRSVTTQTMASNPVQTNK